MGKCQSALARATAEFTTADVQIISCLQLSEQLVNTESQLRKRQIYLYDYIRGPLVLRYRFPSFINRFVTNVIALSNPSVVTTFRDRFNRLSQDSLQQFCLHIISLHASTLWFYVGYIMRLYRFQIYNTVRHFYN